MVIKYDTLLMHGNKVDGIKQSAEDAPIYIVGDNQDVKAKADKTPGGFKPPETPQQSDGLPQRVEAATRAKRILSKSE